jgi:hypothetical protein
MKKGVVIGIGSVLLVGVAIGGYFLWRSTQKSDVDSGESGGVIDLTPPTQPPAEQPPAEQPPTGLPLPTQGCPTKSYSKLRGDSFPLSWGSEGANVGKLQRALNSALDYDFIIDNKFGCITESALREALGKNQATASDLNTLENR